MDSSPVKLRCEEGALDTLPAALWGPEQGGRGAEHPQ